MNFETLKLFGDVVRNRSFSKRGNDEVDLGIVSYPTGSREIEVVPIGDEKMVLCCRPDHHLAGKKQIPLRLLHGEHFVTFDRDLAIHRELDHRLRDAHAAVRVVMEFDNIETIKQAVQIGTGVSVLPEPTVRREVLRRTAFLWCVTKKEPCGRTCAQTAQLSGRKVLRRAKSPATEAVRQGPSS